MITILREKIVPTVCWDYLSEVSSKSKSGLHHIIVTWWKSFFKNTMYVHTYVSERVWFDFLYIMGKIENFVDPGA